LLRLLVEGSTPLDEEDGGGGDADDDDDGP
jgi:hypothetical protein